MGYYVAGPPLLNGGCTSLLMDPRLRNDLYCVEWDVKPYYTIPYHLVPYWCCFGDYRRPNYDATRPHLPPSYFFYPSGATVRPSWHCTTPSIMVDAVSLSGFVSLLWWWYRTEEQASGAAAIDDDEARCPICLIEMVEGESMTVCVTGCQNRLHHQCIERCKYIVPTV